MEIPKEKSAELVRNTEELTLEIEVNFSQSNVKMEIDNNYMYHSEKSAGLIDCAVKTSILVLQLIQPSYLPPSNNNNNGDNNYNYEDDDYGIEQYKYLSRHKREYRNKKETLCCICF